MVEDLHIRIAKLAFNAKESPIRTRDEVFNLVSKPQIGTCGLLVVLITPCSWCYLVYLVEDHMFRSCILLPLWLWTWICFVSSYICSWGHGWSLPISSHVNLVFVRYFDEMYVVSPLVVLCERRLHDTSPLFGPRGRYGELISRWWVARVTEA